MVVKTYTFVGKSANCDLLAPLKSVAGHSCTQFSAVGRLALVGGVTRRPDHIVNNGIIGIFEESKKLKKTFTNTEQCLHDLYPDKGFGNPPSSSCQSSHTALLERRKTFIEAKDTEGLHLFFKSDNIIPTHTPRKKPHH